VRGKYKQALAPMLVPNAAREPVPDFTLVLCDASKSTRISASQQEFASQTSCKAMQTRNLKIISLCAQWSALPADVLYSVQTHASARPDVLFGETQTCPADVIAERLLCLPI